MPHTVQEITVDITFRNTEPTEAIKQFASEKVTQCLQKYVHHTTRAHVVLSVEKSRHIAELVFHADGSDFLAKEETTDMYQSIDQMVATMSHQLRKRKERLTDHHR